jgi:hypothetical protein
LYNELPSFYPSPNIIIKSEKVRLAEYVVCSMEISGMHTGFWLEREKERDNRKDLYINGKLILKWIFRKYNGNFDCVCWLKKRTMTGSCEQTNEPSIPLNT